MKSVTQTILFNPLVLLRHLNFYFSWRIFLRIFRLFLLSFLAILIFFVLFQMSKLARETKNLGILEDKLKVLSQENQDLRIRINQVEERVFLEELMAKLNFEKVEKIHFIKTQEQQVVRRVKEEFK